MVRRKANLKKEANDFDVMYRDRFKNSKSIFIGTSELVEDYYYKNPWRYGFSREYAFGSIIAQFEKLVSWGNKLKILDIGSGNGWFSLNANINNKNFWDCIDISPEAITAARFYQKQLGVVNNSYFCESLENFVRNKKYDFITCINSLHHITDLSLFYQKVKAHLKSSGKIFIYDVSPDLFTEINGAFVLLIRMFLKESKKIRYFEGFKSNDIARRLKSIMYEYRCETDRIKQSYHDHYNSTREIICFLKNAFIEVYFKYHGGILMRLLGGLRGDATTLKRFSKELIALEEFMLERRIISPYTYTFIGKTKPQKKGEC